jgi:hypothetical protein
LDEGEDDAVDSKIILGTPVGMPSQEFILNSFTSKSLNSLSSDFSV